jgi:hypothetical protein
VDSSVVSHTQGWGLQFVTAGAGGSSGNQLTNSLAYDLGAGGVRVGMPPSASDTDANVPQNVTVENNEISYIGQYDPSGIGPAVWIGNAHHVTVTHNDIHHTYSGGIENGFKLGRVQTASSTSYTHDNWITYNHMYDLGLGVTNDFGGIYSATSLSPNCPTQGAPQLTPINTYCNHLVGNVIHDVVHDISSTPGDGYNGIGIYNDQGTSQNDVRNNIVYRTSDSCVFNNLSDRTSDTYDQWNLFENNVFAACGSSKSAVHVALKRGGHNPHSFTFRQNVVSWAQGAYPQQKPGNWDCFDDLQAPTACTNRFALDHNAYWYGTGQTPTFVTCAGAGCGSPGTCGTNPGYNCFNGVSAWNAGTTQEDLLDWFLTPDPARKTNHMSGTGVNTYSYLDADGQKFWMIKNSAGNPWDINLYDDSKIYLWITENGDEVGGWGNPRAWKRALTPRPIAPRHFTPGTTVVYTTTGPAGQSNPGARTMKCETDGEANVYLGDVQGVTTGPATMAWGNDVGTKPTITVNYYYSGNNESYHSRERFFLVKGWGWVQWDLASCAGTCTPGVSIYTVSQTSTKTTLAAGGSPTPNWPCGTSYPWWVGGTPGVGGNASKASGSASIGEDEGSLDSINPLFRNAAAGDYTPTADLSSISFDPIDVLQAGRLTHNSQAPINLKDSFPIRPLIPSDYSNDGGVPVAHVSANSLAYGNQTVGSTTVAQTVTLSNVGAATLAFNSIAATGDFGQTNDCGSMLDVGESCRVNVTFTPTAVGSRTGFLSISDNASGSPQQVSLSGTGTTQVGDSANPYCGPGDTPMFGLSDGPATLPTGCVYTAMAGSPSPGVTTTAVDGADFIAKLAAASCGDTIVLNAGMTYTGKFTLPNKGCDAGHWITIRTSAIADPNFPAESVRATPCEIGQSSVANYPSYTCPSPGIRMPTLVTNQVNTPAIEASTAGATYYRLIGLNMVKAAGSGFISNKLIQLCANGTCSIGSDHIIIDRCLLHGQPWTGITNDDLQGGVGTINSTYIAVIDSWIYDTYCQSNCSDSNAVSGGTGNAPEGPIKLVNNLLASSGETLLWGGGGATAVPHDLEIRRNHSFKPLSWMLPSGGSGAHVINKNAGECKNCQRALFEGNVLENNWTGWQGDQMGYGLLLTPKNQEVYQILTVDIAGTTATRVSGGYFYTNMVGQNFRITGGSDNNQMILITGVGPSGCTNNCTSATLANAPGHGDQSGTSARGCNPGACPNCKVTDVTVRFNEFRNLTRGMQIASVSTQCGTVSSGMSNVSLHDNLMHGLDNRMSNASSPASITVGFDINDGQPVISNIAVAHNTVAIANAPPNSYSGFGFELVQSQGCSNLATGDYLANMTYRDNIAPAAMFPMCGSGAIFGGGVLDGLNYHGCPNHDGLNCTWTWAKNVMGTGQWTSQITKTPYPSGTCGTAGETCLPSGAAFTGIFNNYSSGYQGDYRVQTSSAYHNASSDGKDIGADLSTLMTLTQGVRNATAYSALTISTSVLPSGTTGNAYTQTLAASAGASPFKYWTVSSGSLPSGLTMNLAGVISGTPTTPGTYSFTAQVLDGARQVDTQGLSVTIN